ncbi:MAG: ABC transporter permease [Planctomycetota bacterium]|nr:ABC transporter permease [Planctomycetota bacterium]
MDLIVAGLKEAFHLIFSGDPLVFQAMFRTLWVSSFAVLSASLIAMPLGAVLARAQFFGKTALIVFIRGGIALPTVFVGIFVFALFSRRGPLGSLEILYTPWVIMVGEFLLAFPIILTLTHGAVKALDPRVDETARTLGAGPLQRFLTDLSEARTGILLAVLTAFARCLTELGIAVMVGGNIENRTRTLSTAIAQETAQGEFARGLAMGLILLILALGMTSTTGFLARENA